MAQKQVPLYADAQGVIVADDAGIGAGTLVMRDSGGNTKHAQAQATELKTTALLTLAYAATQTANATLDGTAVVWKFSTSVADLTATLPPASGCAGRAYLVEKVDGNAHNVIVSDGTNTLATLGSKYAKVWVHSDGTSWF